MIEVKTASFMKSTLILSGTLAGIGLLVFSVARHPLTHYSDVKIIQYKNHNSKQEMAETRNQIVTELGLDTLNHRGVSGKMEYDRPSGDLSMIIRNRDGQYIPGIQVVAQLSRTNGQPGPRLLMKQNEKQHYTAPIRGIGSGNWHVTIQAYDPERTSGPSLMFQVEKYLNIE